MISALAAYILQLPAWAALMMVFALPALESSAFVGFVFPGEIALVLGGVLAYQGILSTTTVVILGVSGAVVGDSIGYAIGRRHGRWLLDGTLGRLVRRHHLDRAERYLAARGGKAVFFGRFTAALRVMVPGLAGMARMRYRTFLFYNVSGALLWVTMSVLIGYLGGSSWRHVEHVVSRLGLVILAVFTLVVVVRIRAGGESRRPRRLGGRVRASRWPDVVRARYPRTASWVAARLDPALPTGLSLTVATATVVTATLILFGLTQDVLAHEELALLDPVVNGWVTIHRTGMLNHFWSTVTWLGANVVTVPLLAVTGVVVARLRRSWRPVVDVAIVYAAAVMLREVVAQVVRRPRPPQADWLSDASGWAFPSGHTTQALAAFALVALLVGSRTARRARTIVYSVAVVGVVLVGASRVYLGTNWLTDVLAALAMTTLVLALRAVIHAVHAGLQDDPRQPTHSPSDDHDQVRASTDGDATEPPPVYAGPMHVVVVDDEARMVDLVGRYLGEFDVTTTGCYDGPSGLEAARRPDVDAVVLDLMLPGMDGVEVCRRLRKEGNDVPVLMLTARGAVPERVAGLEAGADDYLVKPFALEELHARLKAIRRRREPDNGHRLVVGDVVLDPLEQRVWIADEEVRLSRREFAMLTSLMENPGRVVSRARLYDDVWDDEVDIRSNALDVHISRLRGRLQGSEQVAITTMRGVGYRLEQIRR